MRLYFFAKIRRDKFENEEYLKRYIKLENGIPSHDTLCRVFGMLQPEILQQLYKKWQELLNKNEGEALKKIICIEGKKNVDII